MLRPAVITRKVGGCNKTLLGALVHGMLASLMVSCQQQGKRFLSLALQLLRSGQPQAIPLASLPTRTSPDALHCIALRCIALHPPTLPTVKAPTPTWAKKTPTGPTPRR